MKTPQTDSRKYRAIVLDNQLTCLLVQDETADKASAAMDVHVGSFHEPLHGLSHFLEHVLFLGTRKYPQENEYSQHLAHHGGHSNAYTSDRHTNYYFDIAWPHLHSALDRFAQFFIEPLFSADGVEREMNAVDSEFKRNLPSDHWRLHRLQQAVSDPQHPFSKFHTGNLESLRVDGVLQLMIDHYQRHYSANLMRLVVLGRQSLDELEQWVRELFTAVPNKNLPELSIAGQHPLHYNCLKKLYWLKPVKDLRTLTMVFATPDPFPVRFWKPASYLSHLIGHESAGSVLSLLKDRGWATALSASCGHYERDYGRFSISIELTVDGLNNLPSVILAVLEYAEMLRQQPLQQWIYDECKQLAEVAFQFQEMSAPSTFTSRAAAVLHDYQPEDVLYGQFMMKEFRPDLIGQVLDCLRVDWLTCFVQNSTVPDCDWLRPLLVADWAKEQWYGLDYRTYKLPLAVADTLTPALPIAACGELHLPERNHLIPSDLRIQGIRQSTPSPPRIIHQTEHCRLWHKLDDSFMTPKANVLVYITTPVDYLTPLHSVLADLLCRLVEDDLRDLSYMAEVAGLHANVDTTRSGSLYFEFSGYSQKIDMLMEAVVGHFRRFSADTSPALRDRKRWLMFAEEMQKECGNFQRSSSMAQTLVFTDYFIRPVFWLETERKSVLDRVLSSEACIKQAMEQTCQFARDLFRQFHMEMVVCGNLPAERAVQMAKRLENIAIDAAADGVGVETVQSQTSALATRADWMDNQYSLIRRSLLLPTAGCRLAHIRQQTDPSHTHSAVDYYIQIGDPADCNLRCHLFLLAQMLHEPAFHQLRTTEQLGYAVRVAQHRSAGVSGLRVIVESEWDSVYVERRIERFLRSYQQRLDGMGDEEFEKSRQAAVSLLRKKDDHWLQESYRWIRHIRSGYFEFDQVETDVCCLMEQVSLQTIREFYRNHVNPDSPRRSKLSVHVRSLQPPKNNETAFSKSEDLMGRLLALLRDKHGMDLEVADLREAIESIGLAGGAALQTIVAGEAESYKQNALPPPVANDGEPIAAEEADLERLADQLFAHLGRRRSDINEREGYKLIDNKETGEQKAIEGGYCLSPGTRVIYPQDLTQFRNSLAMSPAPCPVKPEFLKLIVPAMAADSIKSSL